MASAAFLSPNAANASGGQSIALGNSAAATGQYTIAIGNNADATQTGAIAIGSDTTSGSNAESVVIGNNVTGFGGPIFAIGRNSVVNGSASVSIGNSMNVNAFNSIGISGEIGNIGPSGTRSVGIGRQVTINSPNAVGIGNFAKVSGTASMSFTSCAVATNDQKAANSLMMVPGGYGCTTNAAASDSIVLGSANSQLERASAAAVQGIAIGYNTQTTAAGAVALGNAVVANKDATVSVTELEVQLNGGGISMFSPNGTEYKLTVSDAGALVIT